MRRMLLRHAGIWGGAGEEENRDGRRVNVATSGKNENESYIMTGLGPTEPVLSPAGQREWKLWMLYESMT